MIKDQFELTEREAEVIYTLYLTGMRNQELATELSCSIDTVKTHLRHAYRKMKCSTRSQVIAKINKEVKNTYETPTPSGL